MRVTPSTVGSMHIVSLWGWPVLSSQDPAGEVLWRSRVLGVLVVSDV